MATNGLFGLYFFVLLCVIGFSPILNRVKTAEDSFYCIEHDFTT